MNLPRSNQTENQIWRKEEVFFENDAYYESLLAGIDSAKHTIYFETYIFSKSFIGDLFAKKLCEASNRGVHVRILVDGFGSPSFTSSYEAQLKRHKVEVRLYRSLPWDLHTHTHESLNPIRRFFNRIYRMNHGTHRKYCLIDSKHLWVGSLNICDEHSEALMKEQAWGDVGVYVEGPQVSFAKKAFLKSFESKHLLKEIEEYQSNHLILLNQTRNLKRKNRAGQMSHVRKAKTRIWIETPYFVPIARFLLLLMKKHRDGLDVRIVVPFHNDVWVTKWISYSYLFRLAKSGIKVYEYQRRFLHRKVFIIDDWICIGSSNLNHRSFLHDLELDVVLTCPKVKEQVVKQTLDDMANSMPLNQDIWSAFPWWKRLLSRFLSIFSYWS
tara:strand:+ start:3161 stop:4309 length:1149 start_codon:yes stop_codon:yes gene_type:complete